MSIIGETKKAVQGAVQTVMTKAIELAPDAWIPGGKPDPLALRQHGQVGAPVSRIDGPLKVQGKAPFAAEFRFERMTYAALVFSTVAKGRITAIVTGQAKAAPGVVLVMTHENAPPMKPMQTFVDGGAGYDRLPVMQDDRVRWNGQTVAVVLAETQEQADHAASLIEVSYAAEPPTTTLAQAQANGTKTGDFMGPLHIEIGEAKATLAAAAVSVDATYTTPFQNHNAIEPHAATLAWDGDTLRVHDASQGVVHEAQTLAHIFSIAAADVHVTSPYVGGGFGGKLLWQHQIVAAAAARLAGRPVRIALSRQGVFRLVGGRTCTVQRVAIGASAEGHFEAIVHTGTSLTAAGNALPESIFEATKVSYAADSFKLDVQVGFTDIVANAPMRAPGAAVGTFAFESAVDELAAELGIDPIELRLRNQPERDPIDGRRFSSRHVVEAWRAGAERFEWGKRNSAPAAKRDGEWQVGLGCATAYYPYMRMPGGAARLVLSADGRARVELAVHEMGMGTATAHTQVTAERLGLAPEQVSFAYGDSTLPGMMMAGGSQQTASIGAAVIAAQHKLVEALLKLAGNASPLAGLKADEVGCSNAGLAKLDEPERHESYASILSRASRDELAVEAQAPMPMELTHWSMHSFGAMFCEVRVNAVTGETRVSRFLGSFDCGRILNAKTAASQFRGGIIMGLGAALMEETWLDPRNGRIMNPSLAEYHLPAHLDVPAVDVIWTDIPDPHAPMGAHGIGEIGITGVAAAVANAVFNATGKRVRDLPITLDKLL